jgi:hypothetical protein
MLRRGLRLVFAPRAEWAAIAADPRRPLAILTGYVLPLSAVMARRHCGYSARRSSSPAW